MVRDGASRLLTMRVKDGGLILRSALLRASRRMRHAHLSLLATHFWHFRIRKRAANFRLSEKRGQWRPARNTTRLSPETNREEMKKCSHMSWSGPTTSIEQSRFTT